MLFGNNFQSQKKDAFYQYFLKKIESDLFAHFLNLIVSGQSNGYDLSNND